MTAIITMAITNVELLINLPLPSLIIVGGKLFHPQIPVVRSYQSGSTQGRIGGDAKPSKVSAIQFLSGQCFAGCWGPRNGVRARKPVRQMLRAAALNVCEVRTSRRVQSYDCP